MVKKLLKYEILAYLRVWLPVELILLAVATFARLLQFLESDQVIYEIAISLITIMYIGCISASIVFTYIFAFIRYYKNLFTSEGYLSFTLPVTPAQHIWVKLLTSVLFTVGSAVVAIISFMIFMPKDACCKHLSAFHGRY